MPRFHLFSLSAIFRHALLACALVAINAAPAMADDASDAFTQGSVAFNRQDYGAAFPLFLKAAEMGNMKAQFCAGTLYKLGYGTEQNLEKAREWFGKAAEQGYSAAQDSLGEMFESGAGEVKDLRQAFSWYSKAAAQGYSYAQDHLGKMYESGTGVVKDLHQAFFWYSKAAAQGNDDGHWGKERLLEYGDADSQFVQGIEYESGFGGVSVDKAKALHWFELAAAQGQRDAQAKVNYYYGENRKAEQLSEEIRQQNRGNAAREERAPSIWEINAQKSAEALRDAQTYDNARRSADARRENNCSGSSCNNH